MRSALYPTQVNLKELPDSGEDFFYSRQTGELNKLLKNILGDNDYKINLHLRPVGNIYEITGEIEASMNLLCSHCGRDVKHPIRDKFSEIIMVLNERPRAGHSGHTGLQVDGIGPFCNYMTTYQMRLGEFVHEHLAASEPYTVQCQQPDCDDYFQNAQKSAPVITNEGEKPFAVLKNFPSGSQRS